MPGKTLPHGFSRYPLLWIALWFASGIVVSHAFAPALSTIVAAASVAAVLFRKHNRLLITILFLSLGATAYDIQTRSIGENRIRRIYDEGRIISGEPVEIEGVLTSSPEQVYDGMFLLVRAEKLVYKNSLFNVSGRIRFYLPSDDSGELDLSYGSRLRIYARLEREEKFQNPGVASLVQILDHQGVDATASVKSPLLIEKLGEEPVFLPLAWVYKQRQTLMTRFRENFSPQTAGVMIASLLGNQNFLDRQTSDVFREGGTFHVLVISGLHITFIGGLTLWAVSRFVRSPLIQFLAATGFLWAYTVGVGAEVPVVRASIMFTAILFARVVHRRGAPLNALGLCVLLLLAWRPSDLFSPSFQLTVVSVAAIVGCSFPLIEKLRSIGSWMPSVEYPFPPNVSRLLRRFCEALYWNETAWKIDNGRQIWSANLFKFPLPRLLRARSFQASIAYVFEGLLVSLIVQIWMLPLLVIYFHRISPISLVLNLWVGVLLALESFSAVLAILVGAVNGWLAVPLIEITELLNTMMVSMPGYFSGNRFASFRLPVYPGVWKFIYFLYGLAVAACAIIFYRWEPFAFTVVPTVSRRLAATCLMVASLLGLLIVLHPFSAPRPDGRLTVDFLDVGQGDSALITFPDGATMLVDGGGQLSYQESENDFEPDRRRIGESVVSEFLWEKGYSRVDYLVATHADADHVQGLVDVAKNFDIGSMVIGSFAEGDPDFDALLQVAFTRGISVGTIRRGDILTIGGATIHVLHPTSDTPVSTSSNDSSIVFDVRHGSRSFLFTGDIERTTEADLVSRDVIGRGRDVTKVPHHGSRTSSTSEFVSRVDAGIAVISVGRRSRFGHPHPEVVSRWINAGAKVMKTGDRGTITISTNGEDLRLQTFVP